MYLIESDELLTQAEIYRTQGYKRLEEARVRLRQNRFTEARERLQEARESFRISLGFSEDPELRAFFRQRNTGVVRGYNKTADSSCN